MSEPEKKEKKKRPRRVFGRVVFCFTGGSPGTIWMDKKEVSVRLRFARRTYRLPLEKVAVAVMAQSKL